MSGLLRNTQQALKGGGAKIIAKQIQRHAVTNVFEALSAANDCLGATAGTWHELGSIETIDIPRDSNGIHTLTPTLVEWDKDRRNLLMNIAPFNAAAALKKNEELDLEDGTVIQSSGASQEDVTLPYWAIIYRGAPLADGTETAFFCVAQAKRDGNPGATKASGFNKPKISFMSIDAGGYVCLKPTAAGPDSWVDSITAPTLSGVAAHGIWATA